MDSTNDLTDRATTTPEQPDSPVDRVFQFISDPKHKENLSGRVRAACITCRRKKIKCSGELNCQTCREKGLVCEGLPVRKRPKRDSLESSNILDPLPGGVDQMRRLNTAIKRFSSSPRQRPGSLLRLADVAKSNDSGYGTSSSPAAAIASSSSRARMDPSLDHSESPKRIERISPTPFRVDIWDLTAQQTSQAPRDAESRTESSGPLPRRRASQAEYQKPLLTERNSSQDEISWWNKPHHLISPQTTDLSTAAHIVFGDSAQPAAQPASLPRRPNHIDLDGMSFLDRSNIIQQDSTMSSTSRRQTIHLPLPDTSTSTSSTLPSQQFANINNPFLPNHQPGIFDDMALLLSTVAPPSTNGSNLNELSSWWDINSDLTNMLSQAGDILKRPGGGVGGGSQFSRVLPPPPPPQADEQESVEILSVPAKTTDRESPPNPRKVKREIAVGGFYW